MATISDLRTTLRNAHKNASWAVVGEMFGIPGGTAFRIATTDYEPKRSDIRIRLNLPALAPAPICPVHGVVHVNKRCPVKRKPNPFAGWVMYVPND